MSRLNTIPMGEATGEIKDLYEVIQEKLGTVPNIFQGMAASPVLLKAYLQIDDLIAEGTLSGAEQDIVRLVASQDNDCKYCLAAHTKTAGAQGLSEDEILAVRRGAPKDEKQAALVTFVQRILDTKGFIEDADLQAFRDAGYDDAHVCEVITIIGQKVMSNVFNHVHDTELDFPAAQDL